MLDSGCQSNEGWRTEAEFRGVPRKEEEKNQDEVEYLHDMSGMTDKWPKTHGTVSTTSR
jgi:hypothetical protein